MLWAPEVNSYQHRGTNHLPGSGINHGVKRAPSGEGSLGFDGSGNPAGMGRGRVVAASGRSDAEGDSETSQQLKAQLHTLDCKLLFFFSVNQQEMCITTSPFQIHSYHLA